jgi:uncharacterized protein
MENKAASSSIDDYRYIAFTTFRKNGNPVMTPVWFITQGERVFIWTADDSGKVKRLRNNPCVQLGPSNHSGKLLGEVSEGMGRLVPKEESIPLQKAFKAKYGWQMALFAFLWKIRGQHHTYVEITPPGLGPEKGWRSG